MDNGTRVEAEEDDLFPWATRPLLAYRLERLWRDAETVARSFPKHAPERPLLGQAVLMDLAWLASYLRAASESFPDLEPMRRPLVAFVREHGGEAADEWLLSSYLDQPLRWEYRVRVPVELARALGRVLISSMAWGEMFSFGRSNVEAVREIRKVVSGEIDLAVEAVPCWKEEILEMYQPLRFFPFPEDPP